MLLFKETHRQPILTGEKTETRRLWPKGVRVRVGSVHQAKLRMFDPKSTFARIRILEVAHELLGDIDSAGARSEGYSTVNEYLDTFVKINRLEKVPRQKLLSLPVWRVKFHVVERVAT